MKQFDCVIRCGTVVSHDRSEAADIGIIDGKIAAVGNLSADSGKTEIDARGKRVIPGGIDPHTHLDSEYAGLRGGDTVHSGTLAAAYGGTTCLIDFASGAGHLSQRVGQRRAFFESGNPVIDFGLHCVFGSGGAEQAAELNGLAASGVSSVKYYMNNTDPFSDGVLLELLEASAEAGVLVCVHAENEQIARFRTLSLVKEGRVDWADFPLSRPEICEREAVCRALALAGEAGTGVYIVHVSSGGGARVLARARASGKPFYGETCAHYLTLTDELFSREHGELYKVAPPLRKEADQAALWEALRGGSLQALGSDHVSYTSAEKHMRLARDAGGAYEQDFTKVPDGLPGIELRLPTLIGGVLAGRLSWEELVRVNSYQPARLFGLYPNKGEIAPGFDADIVILDEQRDLTVSGSGDLHMQCDYTPFAGLTYRCMPRTVLVRGAAVIENGAYTGAAPGRYVKRRLDGSLLKSSRALTQE